MGLVASVGGGDDEDGDDLFGEMMGDSASNKPGDGGVQKDNDTDDDDDDGIDINFSDAPATGATRPGRSGGTDIAAAAAAAAAAMAGKPAAGGISIALGNSGGQRAAAAGGAAGASTGGAAASATRSVYDFDIAGVEDKPWTKPGA
jgi:hypothetical protein